MKTKDTIRETLEAYGVTMSALFIPASTYAGDEWRSNAINHSVTIQRGGCALHTPYSQGIAHHPHYSANDRSIDHHNAMLASIEEGKAYKPRSRLPTKKLHAPDIADVFYSLVMDSTVPVHSFEEFCGELGYDTDSISARSTFEACRDVALTMQAMFTHDELNELTELYQEY